MSRSAPASHSPALASRPRCSAQLTGGNPFLLRAMWRPVVEAERQGDQRVIELPDSVGDMVRARIARARRCATVGARARRRARPGGRPRRGDRHQRGIRRGHARGDGCRGTERPDRAAASGRRPLPVPARHRTTGGHRPHARHGGARASTRASPRPSKRTSRPRPGSCSDSPTTTPLRGRSGSAIARSRTSPRRPARGRSRRATKTPVGSSSEPRRSRPTPMSVPSCCCARRRAGISRPTPRGRARSSNR